MDIQLDALLKFPHVTVESCAQQDNEVYLKLRFLNEEARCLRCEKLSSELHQNRPILIRDLSIFGQVTYLKRLSRLCADKTTLYQTITGFQPSIGRHFVAFHTISTTDPEEPKELIID